MLDKDFIICKTRTELSKFIQPITEQLDRPRKKRDKLLPNSL